MLCTLATSARMRPVTKLFNICFRFSFFPALRASSDLSEHSDFSSRSTNYEVQVPSLGASWSCSWAGLQLECWLKSMVLFTFSGGCIFSTAPMKKIILLLCNTLVM